VPRRQLAESNQCRLVEIMFYHVFTNMAQAFTPLLCRTRGWYLAGLALLAFTGCSSWNLPKDFRFPWDEKPSKPPARFTDMWTFTILRQPGLPAVRGFGGRVTFFDSTDKPMKVSGTFTVYAFDARSENPSAATPERKFVFLPKDLPKHHDKTKLGDSYSVWLPWDEVGGEERQLTLIARLEAEGGEVVMGSASQQILSGAQPETKKGSASAGVARTTGSRSESAASAAINASDTDAVRAASYQEETSDHASHGTMCIETINMSPGFVRRSLRSVEPSPAEKGEGEAVGKLPASSAASPAGTSLPAAGLVKDATSVREPESPTTGSGAPTPEPSTRSGLQRFQARRESTAVPKSDPFRKTQRPGQLPSSPPTAPRSVPWHESPDSPADASTKATTTSPSSGQSTQN
jgi:hypothetical protein